MLGVATDPVKIEAMIKWPVPTTVTELRGFLGLTGYYRKFVHHYGLIAYPLTQLLRKKQFQWTTTPVLALQNFAEQFIIETDASDIGIGTVLMQHGQPVAYLSKALAQQHKSLSIYEKEFLALIMAVERWRPHLQRKAMNRLMGLQFRVVYKKEQIIQLPMLCPELDISLLSKLFPHYNLSGSKNC